MSLLGIWQNPHQGTNEPISVLREYFGDQITMYFAFLSFYTRWLVYPAVVGFIFQIWLWSERGFDLTPPVELRTNVTNVTSYANSTMYERVVVVVTGESSDWGLVVYCIFICVWSALFIKFWERKQNALAYYWFTSELSLEEKVRVRALHLNRRPLSSLPICHLLSFSLRLMRPLSCWAGEARVLHQAG
jgi:hypothetical protein